MKLYKDQRNAQVFNLFVYLLLPYMFRAFFSLSSEAGVQFRLWFSSPEYGVSARALTPCTVCWIYFKMWRISFALTFTYYLYKSINTFCIINRDTRWCSWYRYCSTSCEVEGSISDWVIIT
jgi:hypothetical protein